MLSFVQVYYRFADTMARLIAVHNRHFRVGFPVVNVLEDAIILLRRARALLRVAKF